MNHAEQLERETELTRAELEGTLRELRASMTPGSCLTGSRTAPATEWERNTSAI
jgi:hypothetical protein